MSRPDGLRTWIEVSRANLKHNYQVFRRLLKPSTKLMAVAKSNAYGHNLVEFSQEMEKLGADWIGVDSIVEAKTLRENGVGVPILVLGYTLPERLNEAVRLKTSLTVSHPEHLKALEKLREVKPKIHLKIDTGMHRQGFLPEDLPAAADLIETRLGREIIEGIYTHFAAGKNPSDLYATLKQIAAFKKAVAIFERRGIKVLKHAAATAGTISLKSSHFDLVRIGIGLYGLWPSAEIHRTCGERLKLQSALSWKTVISEIKKLPRGSRIGYDFTEKLKRDSLVAVCPVGYWHGFPRHLSERGCVLVGRIRAKVLGRVSMDMITIDVTDVPAVKIGQEVTLLGGKERLAVSAEEMAAQCRTTNYEIVTRLNPLIKRIYK